MSDHHILKTLLTIHLASDASAILNLPFVLNSLTSESLGPSSHLPKWIARVQTLLHSKDPGGRWAGLVLAQKTATISQNLLFENGQAWVAAALPLLSKSDPAVVLKAAIRLLKTIFARSHGASEFRRQVAAPNIPKLLNALLLLIEQTDDEELKVVAMTALTNLIAFYPTLYKPSYPALSSLALLVLDGHPHVPVSNEMLSAASRLYSAIHLSGGKVGSSNLWRKTLDETLAFGKSAFWSLRTTFDEQPPISISTQASEDPTTLVPLQLGRLKCAMTILDDLLGATVYRSVTVPLGAISCFALQLLKVTHHNVKEGFTDPTTHTLELSVISKIQVLGCSLLVSLAKRVDRYIYPHLGQILNTLAFELEEPNATMQHYVLLHTLEILLRRCPSSQSPRIVTRLMKAVLPFISKVLTSEYVSDAIGPGPASIKGRKGKMKVRTYADDDIFSFARPVVYPTDADRKTLLTALEVASLLLQDPHLSVAMQSLSVRVLLAAPLVITRIPPASLSSDPAFYLDVLRKLRNISTDVASGTSSTLTKSLPLIIMTLIRGNSDVRSQRQLDLLLHPRIPPLVWSVPLVEHLCLVFNQESDEEAELRKSLGLYTSQDEAQQSVDVAMDNLTGPGPPSHKSKASLLVPAPPKTPLAAQSLLVYPSPRIGNGLPNENEKDIGLSEPLTTRTEATPEEEQLTPFNPSFIPVPEIQPLQLAPQASRANALSSVTPYIASAEVEDEEMPAIVLDSDSDFE